MRESVLAIASSHRERAVTTWLSRAARRLGHVRRYEPCDLASRAGRGLPADVLLVDAQSVHRFDDLLWVTKYARRLWPHARILAFGQGGHSDIIAAARAGTHGYVLFGADAEDLAQALAVADETGFFIPGGVDLTPERASPNSSAGHPDILELADLTARERQIASLMARGMTNAQISAELLISIETARWHAKNALRKLGIRNRTRLAALWHESVGPPGQAAPSRFEGVAVSC